MALFRAAEGGGARPACSSRNAPRCSWSDCCGSSRNSQWQALAEHAPGSFGPGAGARTMGLIFGRDLWRRRPPLFTRRKLRGYMPPRIRPDGSGSAKTGAVCGAGYSLLDERAPSRAG